MVESHATPLHVTKESLLRLARTRPIDAVDRYLLNRERPAHVFQSDWKQHEEFRAAVADLLEVDRAGVAVVGSASLGFSAKPESGVFGRPFGMASDIDLVVVSSFLFDEAWSVLLSNWGRTYTLTRTTRQQYKLHHKFVFRGWIYPEAFPKMIPFARNWFHSLQTLARQTTAEAYPIKARLYRTWMHARRYHLDGAEKLTDLSEGN